jgi:cell division control protein 7
MDSSQKQIQGACLHTPATAAHPHGRLLSRNDYDYEATVAKIKDKQKQARHQSNSTSDKVGYLANDNRYV